MPTRDGAAPEPIAHLSKKQQANFERDFVRAAKTNPEISKAGRKYIAYGWLMLYESVLATKRRRKAPGECHLPKGSCRCVCHEVDPVEVAAFGTAFEALGHHSKEWWMARAEREGDSAVGAGGGD